jgi:hypothetical protein
MVGIDEFSVVRTMFLDKQISNGPAHSQMHGQIHGVDHNSAQYSDYLPMLPTPVVNGKDKLASNSNNTS